MLTPDLEIKELDFDTYQERQYNETERSALQTRLEHVKIGNRARWENGTWTPQEYPGFALQAMVDADPEYESLRDDLVSLQERIIRCIPRPGALYPLPSASFHQTVANTFSADRLDRAVVEKGLLDSFHKRIGDALEAIPPRGSDEAPSMDLIGIAVFRTAIGILGAFPDRSDFDRIIDFRNAFYEHTDLSSIGLKKTRPFIGHITLAYVEDVLDESEKAQLLETIISLNIGLWETPLEFSMPKAELRRYETLAAFDSDPRYPSYQL